MTSGGARARSGPAPDRNSTRNGRAGADWIRLPASGRKGEPPVFPLPHPSARERAVWANEWKRPQAIMWQAAGQELELALYVRTLCAAEKTVVTSTSIRRSPNGERTITRTSKPVSTSARTTILRMQEYLGLSQPGLARNRWMIIDDLVIAEPAGDGATERPIPISDARARLRRLRDDG